MTPRGTDWGLALLVAIAVATGLATWFAGAPGAAWVFGAHAAVGTAIAFVLVFKLRRVLPRLVAHPARRNAAGALALLLVLAALGSGYAWASAGSVGLAGFTLLAWHAALGGVLAAGVLAHALLRAKRLRPRDVADRRQFLWTLALGAGAVAVWQVQRPAQRALGLPGRSRRFTGSYEAGSYQGNDFPSTSWVADRPRPVARAGWSLAVEGRRRLALSAAELDRGDELVATLDCTGGFYSTQRWSGVRLGSLVDEAGAGPGVAHVRVVSRTGDRWSFGLEHARGLLLATRVGGEPLSHEHGAPCRLVVPDRRGFQWVKWVDRVELHEDPDPGAVASTVLSSFSAAGRGA